MKTKREKKKFPVYVNCDGCGWRMLRPPGANSIEMIIEHRKVQPGETMSECKRMREAKK